MSVHDSADTSRRRGLLGAIITALLVLLILLLMGGVLGYVFAGLSISLSALTLLMPMVSLIVAAVGVGQVIVRPASWWWVVVAVGALAYLSLIPTMGFAFFPVWR